MLFPQAMLRLVWFLPSVRLTGGLQRLSETKAFHLTDRFNLGKDQDFEPLKSQLSASKCFQRQQSAQQILQKLPDKTLLSYQILYPASQSSLPAGCVQHGNQFSLWVGDSPLSDVDTQKIVITEAPKLNLTEDQCALLFKTAQSVGCVGSHSVIDGWVPAAEAQQFSNLLKDEVYLLIAAEQSGLPPCRIPSLFRRNQALQGFAALMGLYDTTGYRELDPTPFLAFSFTLMFGMMFADLGQGLLLFLLGIFLIRTDLSFINQTTAAKAGCLLMPVGLSAAFFGLLFGSVFSSEELIPALGFHPMENVLLYLLSSMLLGVLLICLSMTLGLFNAWRTQRLTAILWDNYGPIGLLFYLSLILFVLGLQGESNSLSNVGLVLACSGLLTMSFHYYKAMEGESAGLRLFASLLESYDFVMKFIMQTFSFIRIAAFTFAHIALSATVMIFVDMASGTPWLAGFTLVVGNLFITLLEGLLVSIQAIRLHFFELFTKFVTGGGIVFSPFTNISTIPNSAAEESKLRGVVQ
ncbi:V-type ATPase 116kDa subunit family protein [Psychromonas aquimarina]|uniref:V-type ATPase 116kDa subunit family protein n=1 Tax=Psychromonas aquimarina TaxID=444919 RepID=UPI000415B6A3|nr:V-type ATPase 116kDa subunit family protein [Psychromonas aquimarina]